MMPAMRAVAWLVIILAIGGHLVIVRAAMLVLCAIGLRKAMWQTIFALSPVGYLVSIMYEQESVATTAAAGSSGKRAPRVSRPSHSLGMRNRRVVNHGRIRHVHRAAVGLFRRLNSTICQ
jgi:hypothetical protein